MTRLSDGSSIEDWHKPPPAREPVLAPEDARLARIEAALVALGDRITTPAPVVGTDFPNFSEIVSAAGGMTSSSPEEIAAELVGRLPAPLTPDVAATVDLAKILEKMEYRLTGIGRQAFGASGPANIASDPTREIGRTTTSGGDKIATETTSAATLAALRPTYKVAEGSAVVTGAGGFQTIVSVTPAAAVDVLGFQSDVAALTDVAYRLRLTVGGVVQLSETITANRNSWVPLHVTVPANTAITVEVDHGEIADQTFRGTINYQER